MNTILLTKYSSHRIFEDAATVFAQNAGDDTLCFGTHDWSYDDIAEARKHCQGKLIAYQSELIYGTGGPWKNELYVSKLMLFDEVWDYSEHNIPWLKQQGIGNVRYVPVEPSPLLRCEPQERSIDILHIGSHSHHRCRILNALIKRGYMVYDVVQHHNRYVFGDDMRSLYMRSGVVLGIHSYESVCIQESFRYQFPLSNGIKVLAERSLSNPLHIEQFDGINDLDLKLQLLAIPRKKCDRRNYLMNYIFPYDSLYLVDVNIDNLKERNWKEIVAAVRLMRDNVKVVNELCALGERAEETMLQTTQIFCDMKRLMLLIFSKGGVENGRLRTTLIGQLHWLYNSLSKPVLRSELLATGGHVWPRVRCILQLHGWWLFCAAMYCFIAMGKGNKFVGKVYHS